MTGDDLDFYIGDDIAGYRKSIQYHLDAILNIAGVGIKKGIIRSPLEYNRTLDRAGDNIHFRLNIE